MTTEPKWTQGPWFVTESLTNEFRVRQGSSDAVICTMEDGGHYECEIIPLSDREANARLIAQAPAMAEALEGMLNNFGDIAGDCTDPEQAQNEREAIDVAVAALAKARGEHLKPEDV